MLLTMQPRKPVTSVSSSSQQVDFRSTTFTAIKKAPQQAFSSSQSTVSKYLKQLEEEVQEEVDEIINGPDHLPSSQTAKQQFNDDDYYIVYYHCPVCLVPGHKSASKTGFTIAHIKQCAAKMSLHTRDLISLIKSCPQRQRLRAKVLEKKKTRNQQKNTKRKASNGDKMNCFLDLPQRIEATQRRIAHLLLPPEKLSPCFPGPLEPFVPRLWEAARLAITSEEYVLEDFRKYFPSAYNQH